MSFTRTASGIANSPFFYGSEIVVYTEGKILSQATASQPLDDELFYSSLLRHILPHKTFKIKCVGNKAAALGYADIIDKHGIGNGLVFVDRDLCGLTHSLIGSKCIIQTRGYSWENDLWTEAVCARILRLFTHGLSPTFNVRYKNLERRLRVLSILDASLQPLSIALLSKKSQWGGVAFDFQSTQPISHAEIRRLLTVYRAYGVQICNICRQVAKNAAKFPAYMLVQGHLWSNAVRGLLARVYREYVGETAPSKRAFLNIALSELNSGLNGLLGRSTVTYYRKSIQKALAP